MTTHLSKRFTTEEVAKVIQRYLNAQIDVNIATALLQVKRRRFFDLVKKYRDNPKNFCLRVPRQHVSRSISEQAKKYLLIELETERKLINDKNNPLRRYNYSYLKSRLAEKYQISVSLSSIIRFAKKKRFTNKKFHAPNMIEK